MENVQNFINNDIQKILMQECEIKNIAIQVAYQASVKKSSELVQCLSYLLLEAYNNVNCDLNYLINKMLKMEDNEKNIQLDSVLMEPTDRNWLIKFRNRK